MFLLLKDAIRKKTRFLMLDIAISYIKIPWVPPGGPLEAEGRPLEKYGKN